MAGECGVACLGFGQACASRECFEPDVCNSLLAVAELWLETPTRDRRSGRHHFRRSKRVGRQLVPRRSRSEPARVDAFASERMARAPLRLDSVRRGAVACAVRGWLPGARGRGAARAAAGAPHLSPHTRELRPHSPTHMTRRTPHPPRAHAATFPYFHSSTRPRTHEPTRPRTHIPTRPRTRAHACGSSQALYSHTHGRARVRVHEKVHACARQCALGLKGAESLL
eukprot:6181453-Pleurochrysis_carterae.AAC.2